MRCVTSASKNHRLFLEAAARVTKEDALACFVIVGDGVLRPEIEAYARDLGFDDRVIFTGWRRDLPRIYADLHALAVTSTNEGTPVSAAARHMGQAARAGVREKFAAERLIIDVEHLYRDLLARKGGGC